MLDSNKTILKNFTNSVEKGSTKIVAFTDKTYQELSDKLEKATDQSPEIQKAKEDLGTFLFVNFDGLEGRWMKDEVVLKSLGLSSDEIQKARGLPDGTVRIWSGEKHERVNGKWVYRGKAKAGETHEVAGQKENGEDKKVITKEQITPAMKDRMLLKDAGFDDKQIDKMNSAAKKFAIENKVDAKKVSITPDGELHVIGKDDNKEDKKVNKPASKTKSPKSHDIVREWSGDDITDKEIDLIVNGLKDLDYSDKDLKIERTKNWSPEKETDAIQTTTDYLFRKLNAVGLVGKNWQKTKDILNGMVRVVHHTEVRFFK